jgi:hypothetical protein
VTQIVKNAPSNLLKKVEGKPTTVDIANEKINDKKKANELEAQKPKPLPKKKKKKKMKKIVTKPVNSG